MTTGTDSEQASAVVGPTRPRLFQMLGPGLITGASDDDPSGIATYSQAGAQLGFSITWTMLFTYPLMSAVQEISARVGRATGRGIAGNIRRHYPNWLFHGIVGLLFIANTINIGADLGAMADALGLGRVCKGLRLVSAGPFRPGVVPQARCSHVSGLADATGIGRVRFLARTKNSSPIHRRSLCRHALVVGGPHLLYVVLLGTLCVGL